MFVLIIAKEFDKDVKQQQLTHTFTGILGFKKEGIDYSRCQSRKVWGRV